MNWKDCVTGVRLSFKWCGAYRSVEGQWSEKWASDAEAEKTSVSHKKKIWGHKPHQRIRDLESLKTEISREFRTSTLPFVGEKGVRLCSKEKYSAIQACMEEYQNSLKEAVKRLQEDEDQVFAQAKQSLGQL